MASAWGNSWLISWGASWGAVDDVVVEEKQHGTPWWVRKFLIDLEKKKKLNEAMTRLLLLID